MKIDRKDVVGIDGLYISALYNDYYAVDFYVMCDGQLIKMRYPFKTHKLASQMMDYLHGRNATQPIPDYRRDVWFAQINKKTGIVR